MTKKKFNKNRNLKSQEEQKDYNIQYKLSPGVGGTSHYDQRQTEGTASIGNPETPTASTKDRTPFEPTGKERRNWGLIGIVATILITVLGWLVYLSYRAGSFSNQVNTNVNNIKINKDEIKSLLSNIHDINIEVVKLEERYYQAKDIQSFINESKSEIEKIKEEIQVASKAAKNYSEQLANLKKRTEALSINKAK